MNDFRCTTRIAAGRKKVQALERIARAGHADAGFHDESFSFHSAEELARLLQASGSPLTPEEYLASLPEEGPPAKYRSRARAAAWSKSILLLVTILSVVGVPFLGIDLEAVIIVAGLATVTFFEYRVHRYFLEGDPAAPTLGFRNQAAFAAAILIYGLYHAFSSFQIPAELSGYLDADTMVQAQSLTRLFYLFIGIVGGVSQFGLAWYYRSASVPTRV